MTDSEPEEQGPETVRETLEALKNMTVPLLDAQTESRHGNRLANTSNQSKSSDLQSPNLDKSDSKTKQTVDPDDKSDFETMHHRNAREKNMYEIRTNGGDELNTRERGKKLAAAIVRGNPNIADLSDANRPTKIAEGCSELYDNEWTNAYEELTKKRNTKDTEAIMHLLKIVKKAFKFCTEHAEQQLLDMHKRFQAILMNEDDKNRTVQNTTDCAAKCNYAILSQLRKPHGDLSIPDMQKKFIGETEYSRKMEKYVKTAVELCWWMCIQDPPVYMCTRDDKEQCNPDFYRAYTRSGNRLDYYVWPALRLYKDGPLLYRGVAQYK